MNDIAAFIIALILIFAVVGGLLTLIITFIINSIRNVDQTRKYYILTFCVGSVIGLLGLGICCSSI